MKYAIVTAILHVATGIGVNAESIEMSESLPIDAQNPQDSKPSKATAKPTTRGIRFETGEDAERVVDALLMLVGANKPILVSSQSGGGQLPVTPRTLVKALATTDRSTTGVGVVYA